MKSRIIKILYFCYHCLFPSINRTCRYQPTCSQYALGAITKYGLIVGLLLSAKRITSCHPFSKRPIYDPV